MRWTIVLTVLIGLGAASAFGQQAPAGKILYSRASGDGYRLHVMNADGTGDVELPNQPRRFNTFGAWSRDGKKITFTGFDNEKFQDPLVFVANADGSDVRQLPSPEVAAAMSAFSPDGAQLAFMAGDPSGTPPMAYTSDLLGNGASKISADGSVGFAPFWSADGKSIFYTGAMRPDDERRTRLMRYTPVDDSRGTVLEFDDGIVIGGANALSPDGKRAVLLSFREGAGEDQVKYQLVNIADGGSELLLEFQGNVGPPESPLIPTACWSPDGKSVLLTMRENNELGIFAIDLATRKRTRLTPAGVSCGGPAWLAAK